MLLALRALPTRAADDFLPGHNICANGVQCDQYGIGGRAAHSTAAHLSLLRAIDETC